MKSTKILKRKSDGWYVAPGSTHTSDPASAIPLDDQEVREWLFTWGSGYEAVDLADAKGVE